MVNLFPAIVLLLDVSRDPARPIPWVALMVLLVIVFLLAVSITAGLVFLLIWLKRRKLNSP